MYVMDLTECPDCHKSKDFLHEYGSKMSTPLFQPLRQGPAMAELKKV